MLDSPTIQIPLEDSLPAGQATGHALAAHGGFFAVDRRVWRRVVDLGMNAAVAFLVLARGSGGDNATTSWSTDAVERYTGISRHKAKDAIALLEREGVLLLVRGGTKPSRKILPAAKIPWCSGCKMDLTECEEAFLARLPLSVVSTTSEGEADLLDELVSKKPRSKKEQQILDGLLDEQFTLSAQEWPVAVSLVRKGRAYWAKWLGGGWRLDKDEREVPDADWIWLPNTLIDGAAGEIPPVEIIRQTQDLGLLRVFIEFYHAQSLIRHGGLDPTLYSAAWGREHVATIGEYVIWSFWSAGGLNICPLNKDPFLIEPVPDWRKQVSGEEEIWHGSLGSVMVALSQLRELGLIEAVPYLYEGQSDDAEAIHPIALGSSEGVTTEAERKLAAAAVEAAHALCPSLVEQDNRFAVPVHRHIRDVEARGVFRLRYRPHTSATAQWAARDENWTNLAAKFEAVPDAVIARLAG